VRWSGLAVGEARRLESRSATGAAGPEEKKQRHQLQGIMDGYGWMEHACMRMRRSSQMSYHIREKTSLHTHTGCKESLLQPLHILAVSPYK
jgi:hypothetical protein